MDQDGKQGNDLKIALTGTPATGKTTLAKKLSDTIGAIVIDLTSLVHQHELHEEWDGKRDCYIIDAKKVQKFLDKKQAGIHGPVIYDGLFSHHLKVTHILVLRCPPNTLLTRLGKRGYGKEKIRQNLETEYIGLITEEAVEQCENVMEIISGEVDLVGIQDWLQKGGKQLVDPDWSQEFTEILSQNK